MNENENSDHAGQQKKSAEEIKRKDGELQIPSPGKNSTTSGVVAGRTPFNPPRLSRQV